MRKRDFERLQTQLQQRIRYCASCQPYDEGAVVWILGSKIELNDLLDEYDVPENFRNAMVEGLSCPECGRPLDRFDDVGELEPWELVEERTQKALWRKRYKKFGAPLIEFEELLSQYPMLGLQHPMGKKLLSRIPRLKSINLTNQVWYRAQLLDQEEKPTLARMGPPPLGLRISEGRFNHQGQPLFYLADTQEHAVLETVENDLPSDRICWVQRFAVVEAQSVLSLRRDDYDDDAEDEIALLATALVVSGRLTQRVDRSKGWKPEYFLTRFIADCSRKAGYAGIIFESSRHIGDNLVLFCGMNGVIGEGNPVRIKSIPRKRNPFLREVAF